MGGALIGVYAASMAATAFALMPHVVLKTIGGKSKEQLQEAAEQLAAVVNKSFTQ